MLYKKLFIGMAAPFWLSLFAAGQSLQAAEPIMVATPRASVLATTATNRPFLAATKAQQPVDLAARGYAETELLVRGLASANQSYATRILVRRPVDARKFSGRVIVEVLDWTRQYETAPLWGFSWEHFLRHGDVWVGLTISPVAAASLRRFNATRYSALDLATSPPEICEKSRQGAPGFAWDVMAQVGALLRSSSKENPLLGLDPQRVLAAGYAQGAEAVTSFAVAVHGGLRLGDGAPIFDGYLDVPGLSGSSLDHCAVQFSTGDARLAGLRRELSFVSVLTEMDLLVPAMRAGGDARGEGFRMQEIAGVAGAGPMPAGLPSAADIAAAGVTLLAQARCREPLMDQMLAHALNAVWQQFDDLLVLKQPMASVPHIEATMDGSTAGGWRLPQLDLPVAGRVPGGRRALPPGTQQVCNAATGSLPRFDAATLKQLYHTRAEYLRRFNAAVDQAVATRMLVKEDADALKAAMARGLPAF